MTAPRTITRHRGPRGAKIVGTVLGHQTETRIGLCTHTIRIRPDGADADAPALHALQSHSSASQAAQWHMRLLALRGRRVEVRGSTLHLTPDCVTLLGVTAITTLPATATTKQEAA